MEPVSNGQRDFDFLHGKWTSKQRKLLKRLQNSNEWVEFDAELECYPVLGNTGNIDFMHGTLPNGEQMEGMSIRLFDPERQAWRIYWAAKGSSEVFPPVIGTFNDGVGHFEGDDTENGVPIKVTFEWTDITPTSATWTQAFSADGGETWETNWVNTFTRIE
jgi:hypothetical protein